MNSLDQEYIQDILEDPRNLLGEDNEDIIWAVLKINPELIQYVDFPTEEMQLYVVSKNGNCIRDLENPSEDVKIAAIKQNGYALNWIENASDQLKEFAIKRNIDVFQTIENPSEELQLLAVNKRGLQLEFIKNPSYKVIKAALTQNGLALQYLERQTQEFIETAIKQNSFSIMYANKKLLSNELIMLAIENNPEVVQVMEDLKEEHQLAAVRLKPEAIRFIDEPSEIVQLSVIKTNPSLFRLIKNPSNRIEAKYSEISNRKKFKIDIDHAGRKIIQGENSFIGKIRRFRSNVIIVDNYVDFREGEEITFDTYEDNRIFNRKIAEVIDFDKSRELDKFSIPSKPSLDTIKNKNLIRENQVILVLKK